MRLLTGIALCLAAGLAMADGVSLTDAWKAAMDHDPAFAAARAQREAGQAAAAQGHALWKPTLTATGSAAGSDLKTDTSGAAFSAPGFGSTNGVDFRTSVNGGTATRWAIAAEQPLFDMDRLAGSTAAKNAGRIAEAQYREAHQDLMLRTARSYFDVIHARDQLDTLRRLHAAAENARAAAKARYEAGDITATDMREAEASADAIDVQELDARTALTLAEAAFSDLTGLDALALLDVPDAVAGDAAAPEPLEVWIQRALHGSPQLLIRQFALDTADTEVTRYGAFASPRVSLVAQVARDSLHGDGDFGAAEISSRNASIGIQAVIPLYTGGMRSAKRYEARAHEHQAQAELDGAEQQVRQKTRATWLSVTSAAARVQALRRLRGSAASRLEATKLGVQVGNRTVLELLTAQADALHADADFRRAQEDWLFAGLQLKAVAGDLGASDLELVDRQLAPLAAKAE